MPDDAIEPTAVRIVYIARGVSKYEMYGPEEVAARYGVPVVRAGDAYAEMAMLRGDPSDGLPGVPGVGDKTAAQVVSKFDSWADLIGAVVEGGDPRLSAAVRAKLVKAAQYLTVAPEVVLVAKDAPIDWTGTARPLPHQPAGRQQHVRPRRGRPARQHRGSGGGDGLGRLLGAGHRDPTDQTVVVRVMDLEGVYPGHPGAVEKELLITHVDLPSEWQERRRDSATRPRR